MDFQTSQQQQKNAETIRRYEPQPDYDRFEEVALVACQECRRDVDEREASRNWGICDRCAKNMEIK